MTKKTFVLLTAFIAAGLFWAGFSPEIQAKKNSSIKQLIKHLEVGNPVTYGNLSIVPVYLDGKTRKTNIVTLDEAFKKNWIEVTEIDGGRVPEVRITNRTKHKIFLMGGEILTGCKQDRILAGDILLGPYTKNLKAPVYCVEHGRWNTVSKSFYSKDNLGTYSLRAKAQTKAPSAQTGIWEKIESENQKMGVKTSTSAYQAAYDKKENRARIGKIEKKMKQIPHLYDDTIGVVIGLGERVVSVDVFADPSLFKHQWPKILKSSALSSISSKRQGILTKQKAVEFFQYVMKQEFYTKPAVDLGLELSLTNTKININVLEYQSAILHLAGFPQETDRIKIGREDDLEQRIRVIREPTQLQR